MRFSLRHFLQQFFHFWLEAFLRNMIVAFAKTSALVLPIARVSVGFAQSVTLITAFIAHYMFIVHPVNVASHHVVRNARPIMNALMSVGG